MKRRLIMAVASCLLLFFSGIFAADIVFTPAEWNFGSVKAGDKIEQKLSIENRKNETVEIKVISTCDCLLPESAAINLKPKEKKAIDLKYDSSNDSGKIKKFFMIRSDQKELSKALFPVSGTVVSTAGQQASVSSIAGNLGANAADSVSLYYYYTAGCKKCEKFLNQEIPALEKELGKHIVMIRRDVMDTNYFDEYQRKLGDLGITAEAFPVVIEGRRVLQGSKSIEKNIRTFLTNPDSFTAGSGLQDKKSTLPFNSNRGLFLIPVVVAGLLDGINPCAFTTLIFLLSYLALAGKSRREILIIGIFFTATVFLTYSLIGLGFFHALRAANSVPVVATVIKWVLTAVLFVFTILNIYDYIMIRKGKIKNIILQLPDSMKERIHQSIRTYARSAALMGSAVVLGFLVGVFEIACTGQIYFPIITYYIRVQKQVSLFFFLAAYNFCFILPLIVVFILTYIGVSSKNLTSIFQKNLGLIKLGTAVLFVVLMLLVIIF